MSNTASIMRCLMSGLRIGGSGSEMSSNAIVSFIPGFRREGSGSESPSGFKRASFIAPSGSESPSNGSEG